MPCWYFEKKEIKNSPSYLDGIDTTTECRYRREGARFIVDAGTKLGLSNDTCATGVVYFHRFYMFHSFKDFHRYVTAACCLFLAGKVEETPKKCKDIVKISQQILNVKQFAVFGSDPKEEVMTLERILLQTIKFDLQTEHPYAYLLKFAKLIKADKEKVQKLVQMSWTFINDSLCTTLCLQWEPEIIAASLMYLGTRLNKFDITDWAGKVQGTKQKWWESLVEDLSVDLMEDVCHQVLDLYSPSNQPGADSGESPPPPPPGQPNSASRTPNSQGSDRKRSLQSTPSDPVTPGTIPNKSHKVDPHGSAGTPQKVADKARSSAARQPAHGQPAAEHPGTQVQSISSLGGSSAQHDMYAGQMASSVPSVNAPPATAQYSSNTGYSQYNPYVASSQYQSSFMSGEGAKDIQSLMGTQAAAAPGFTQAQSQYGAYTQPPPQMQPGVPQPSTHQLGQQYGMQGQSYPPGYNPTQYPASAAMPGPVTANTQQNFQQPSVPAMTQQQQYQAGSYTQQQYQQYQNYQQQQGYDPQQQQQHSQSQHKYQGSGAYPGAPAGPRPRSSHNQTRHPQPHPRSSTSSLTQVRISGR